MDVISYRPLTPEGLQESVDVWDSTPHSSGGGGTGTDNYNDLSGKPQINGFTLSGNKTAANLGLATASQVNSAISTATTAASSVTALQSTVSTHTTQIASIADRVNSAEGNITSLQTTVAGHTTQINTLNTSKASTAVVDAIDTRVTALEAVDPSTAISSLQARVATAEGDIDTLETDKANVSVTNSLQVSVTALQTTKANQADLTALQTVVGQKASATDVATLQADVTTLNADSTTVGSVDYKIQQSMATVKSYKEVATLPTASASTQGAIYIISAGQADSGQLYITVEDGSGYSWYNVGGADSIDLSQYVKVVDLNEYKATVTTAIGAVDTKADTNATDIASLSDTVDTKADESDLQQLAARVGVNETNIALKANATDLTALDTRVTSAETAITGLASSKQDTLTFDSTPTEDSNNVVKSGGVFDALALKANLTDLPTNTSDLTNDSGFVTKAVNDLVNYYLTSDTYTKAEVNHLINTISGMHFESVTTLPVTDISTSAIYLVPKSDPESSNVKDEYINLDGTTTGWELIGSTEIDLSGYQTKDLTTAVAGATTVESALRALNTNKQDAEVNISVGGLPYYTIDAAIGAVDSIKADKVSSATNGNLASLDANGNLVDSGIASTIVPSGASSSNKLVTASDISMPVVSHDSDVWIKITFAHAWQYPLILGVYSSYWGGGVAVSVEQRNVVELSSAMGNRVLEAYYWGSSAPYIYYIKANSHGSVPMFVTNVSRTPGITIETLSSAPDTTGFVQVSIKQLSSTLTTSDLTSSVTSGSTAPVTSGGVYSATIAKVESIKVSFSAATTLSTAYTFTAPKNGVYRITAAAQWNNGVPQEIQIGNSPSVTGQGYSNSNLTAIWLYPMYSGTTVDIKTRYDGATQNDLYVVVERVMDI